MEIIDYKTAEEYILSLSSYMYHQNTKIAKLKEIYNFDEDALDQQIIKEEKERLQKLMEGIKYPTLKISDRTKEILRNHILRKELEETIRLARNDFSPLK